MLHFRIANGIRALLFRMLFGHRFGAFGRGSRIVSAIAIEGPGRIFIGERVYVAAQSCLATRALDGGECRLELGDGATIGRFNHIYATRRVIIGRDVLTANGVYIADNLHDYRNPDLPVIRQPVRQCADTVIGDGSWIGHNACIIGVAIGRNCVIGAGAVVLRDIPDHCVAAGAPARIVRRYDPARGEWLRTDDEGRFIESAPPSP